MQPSPPPAPPPSTTSTPIIVGRFTTTPDRDAMLRAAGLEGPRRTTEDDKLPTPLVVLGLLALGTAAVAGIVALFSGGGM